MSSCRNPGQDWASTILGEFAMDGCLDEIRGLNAEMGLRPYRVFLVRTRWSGSSRGEGTELLVSEEELTPAPKVENMETMSRQLLDVGMDETGGLTISEISPRYTENQLLGLSSDGREIAENETFSWEIVLFRGDGAQPHRRRYIVRGAPAYLAEDLQWKVRLTRAGTDREADGTP